MADSSSGRQVYPSKVCRQRSVYSLEKKSEEEEGKEQGEIRKQKKNKKIPKWSSWSQPTDWVTRREGLKRNSPLLKIWGRFSTETRQVGCLHDYYSVRVKSYHSLV